MYTSFFGLHERPFAITPDPRYLYLSERHAEALAHLLYGIEEAGGFVQLTGEVGTGKTTVVRTLLSRVPRHADVAVIVNPRVTPAEFLLTICEELGVSIGEADRRSVKELVDALNRRLLAAHAEGRRVILIVDEAQNLSPQVLEHVRLLTNLETPTQKLLQIILVGQPELRELLDRTELRQLAQRVTGRYHLSPLSREETRAYVRHRLRVAGASAEIFTAGALNEVHRLSSGIPRVINVCCDRALLGAYTRETRKVTASLIRRAAGEVYARRFVAAWIGWLAAVVAALGIASSLYAVWRIWGPQPGAPRTASVRAARHAAPPTLAPETPHSAPIATPTVAPTVAPAATSTALAAPPAAKPASPELTESINAELDAMATPAADADAYRRLFALWGTKPADDSDPCAQATKSGLACLAQRGSWAQVRMLDRPAILTLTDDQGRPHSVLLTALTDRAATLTVGAHTETVPLEALAQSWFGEFTVVWKPKILPPRELSEGMSGPDVRWLRRSLYALRGAAADPARDDIYDKDLAAAVRDFQRTHRLQVDGIAGYQTQVVLDRALADPKSPLLAPATTRGG